MAELNIRERQAGDVTILDLEGRITIGDGNVSLRNAIRRLIQEGKKKILLNLTQKIQDLLAITKLLTVFDTYEDESAALNSFL